MLGQDSQAQISVYAQLEGSQLWGFSCQLPCPAYQEEGQELEAGQE